MRFFFILQSRIRRRKPAFYLIFNMKFKHLKTRFNMKNWQRYYITFALLRSPLQRTSVRLKL